MFPEIIMFLFPCLLFIFSQFVAMTAAGREGEGEAGSLFLSLKDGITLNFNELLLLLSSLSYHHLWLVYFLLIRTLFLRTYHPSHLILLLLLFFYGPKQNRWNFRLQ